MIHFKRVTASNVLDICYLSKTLNDNHKRMVADNALSIAQGSVSDNSWYRGIYLEDEPVGFIMTHTGSDYEDGLDVAGVFLWRLMISAKHQGKGYGKVALDRLINELKAKGYNSIETSVELGEGSPIEFYKKYGFKENGQLFGEEIGLTYKFKE